MKLDYKKIEELEQFYKYIVRKAIFNEKKEVWQSRVSFLFTISGTNIEKLDEEVVIKTLDEITLEVEELIKTYPHIFED